MMGFSLQQFSTLGPILGLHDPFRGLNSVLAHCDYHHLVRREILPSNGGLTFLLPQILKFRIFMTTYFRI